MKRIIRKNLTSLVQLESLRSIQKKFLNDFIPHQGPFLSN